MIKKTKMGPSSSGRTLACGAEEAGSNPAGPFHVTREGDKPDGPTGPLPKEPVSYFILAPPPKTKLRGLPVCWTIYKVENNVYSSYVYIRYSSYVYIRKPRNVDQKKFDQFMRNMIIHGPQSGEGF